MAFRGGPLPDRFFRKTALVFMAGCIALPARAGALAPQSAAGAPGATVQELYSEARVAEGRGDLPTAIAKYESLIQAAPDLPAAYNNLGALYFKNREYAKAAAVLQKALALNSQMPSASALLGMAFFEGGEFAKARQPLEAAVHANPSDHNLELLLVNDLTRLGDFESAAAHLEQLKKRQPSDPQVWYLLANVYTQLAQQALAKMNSIDPNSVWAHEVSGEILEGMKQYDAALVEYKRALEVAPRQPGAHYKLGDLYWSLSRWEEATREFDAELTNDPGNCMAQWKIGDTLLQQSIKPEEALADVNKALSMCPNLAEARLDRGRLLLKLHRNEDAISDLRAAADANPNEPTAHFSLAQAYRALGRTQEAHQEMEVFSKLDAAGRAATAQRAEETIRAKEIAH
jgi:tetratricopeptide (TPR) repeat protein